MSVAETERQTGQAVRGERGRERSARGRAAGRRRGRRGNVRGRHGRGRDRSAGPGVSDCRPAAAGHGSPLDVARFPAARLPDADARPSLATGTRRRRSAASLVTLTHDRAERARHRRVAQETSSGSLMLDPRSAMRAVWWRPVSSASSAAFSESVVDRGFEFSVPADDCIVPHIVSRSPSGWSPTLAVLQHPGAQGPHPGANTIAAAQQPAPPSAAAEISTTIRIDAGGAPPRLAVPDFIALSSDAETAAIARTIAQVLYDDLAFEREFALIPRDTYASIPAGQIVHRRALRPLARAERGRAHHRHRPEDGRRRPRPGAAVQGLDARIGVRQGVQRIGERAALRPHDCRRGAPAAARAARRGAHPARLRLGPRRRADRRHDRAAVGQGDLLRRLRRREPEAVHGEPVAEHHARVVARQRVSRVRLVPARPRRQRLRLEPP